MATRTIKVVNVCFLSFQSNVSATAKKQHQKMLLSVEIETNKYMLCMFGMHDAFMLVLPAQNKLSSHQFTQKKFPTDFMTSIMFSHSASQILALTPLTNSSYHSVKYSNLSLFCGVGSCVRLEKFMWSRTFLQKLYLLFAKLVIYVFKIFCSEINRIC